MPILLKKVTCFVTRQTAVGPQLLLFQHPTAGIQLPAGTVEEGESTAQAALREAQEETGLNQFSRPKALGFKNESLLHGKRVMARTAVAYARPDKTSFDWATIRRGIWVQEHRQQNGFCHVTYQEPDQQENPQYLSFVITGWVEQTALADVCRRHFYHLTTTDETPAAWDVAIDNHVFHLFWADLHNLPQLQAGLEEWLTFFRMGAE